MISLIPRGGYYIKPPSKVKETEKNLLPRLREVLGEIVEDLNPIILVRVIKSG